MGTSVLNRAVGVANVFVFFCQFMRDVAFQGANMYIFVLSKMFFYVFCPIQSLFVRLR